MLFAWAILVFVGANPAPPWTPKTVPQCDNVFQLTETVYSGSEPHGEAALKALAAKGIKTIVSVDGARPDVEGARKLGIRYIHLPIGYDGFERERSLQFGRVLTDVEGPVYFHCHHGKHRGPAAVAAGMEATGQWDPKTANAFLKAAGTSEKYAGLYAAIDEFKAASAEELAGVRADFPEVADLPPFQESMAVLDRRKDALALAGEAGWKTPRDHPDIAPAHEALQLREIFTELVRVESETGRPQDFKTHMRDALASANALEAALGQGDTATATARYKQLLQACSACHDTYRN